MNQRPSRHCVKQLVDKSQNLADQNVSVILVQASCTEPEQLDNWARTAKISLPLGMVKEDAEKQLFTWGVQGLPWLILTDQKHVVRAEGFGLNELDNNINALTEN